MNLNDLTSAIQRLPERTPREDSRAATYLRTYPALLDLASRGAADDATRFLQLAAAVYGWMPRIVRVDASGRGLDRAVVAFGQATAATDTKEAADQIKVLAACLNSVVGASKVLHFANPELFPIWDSKVERLRLSQTPSQNHMKQVANYAAYLSEVHAIRKAPNFPGFYRDFQRAFDERLKDLNIPPYRLTEVRCVESAMFELASDKFYEGDDFAEEKSHNG